MSSRYTNKHRPFEYIPFPKLGSGSQFHAYDTHDGRVLKLPLTKEETYVVIADRHHNMNPYSPKESASVDARVHTIVNGKSRIPKMISHSFVNTKDFLTLMGNPEIVPVDKLLPEDTPTKQWGAGRVVYTQDKVMMVGDLLKSLNALPTLGDDDISKLKRIIDFYIEQTYKMWSFGYSDYVFKIGDTGMDQHGKLTLIDLGEYTNDPEFVKKAVTDQRWLHSIIASKIDFPQLPKQLHTYFKETCNNALTVENLEQYWGTNHICNECQQQENESDAISAFIAAKATEIDLVDRW